MNAKIREHRSVHFINSDTYHIAGPDGWPLCGAGKGARYPRQPRPHHYLPTCKRCETLRKQQEAALAEHFVQMANTSEQNY